MSYRSLSEVNINMAARYESDSDDSIPELDISLRVNVQPYQYEPVRQGGSPLTDNESASDSPHSEDQSDECPSPSDMQWFVYIHFQNNRPITLSISAQ
jgi:hypothetical protein